MWWCRGRSGIRLLPSVALVLAADSSSWMGGMAAPCGRAVEAATPRTETTGVPQLSPCCASDVAQYAAAIAKASAATTCAPYAAQEATDGASDVAAAQEATIGTHGAASVTTSGATAVRAQGSMQDVAAPAPDVTPAAYGAHVDQVCTHDQDAAATPCRHRVCLLHRADCSIAMLQDDQALFCPGADLVQLGTHPRCRHADCLESMGEVRVFEEAPKQLVHDKIRVPALPPVTAPPSASLAAFAIARSRPPTNVEVASAALANASSVDDACAEGAASVLVSAIVVVL
jgi:hypothetical protein